MKDITLNGYHLPTVAAMARKLGSPTDGHLAETIWHISTDERLPEDIAAEFMRDAGYVPFAGYPLTRLVTE